MKSLSASSIHHYGSSHNNSGVCPAKHQKDTLARAVHNTLASPLNATAHKDGIPNVWGCLFKCCCHLRCSLPLRRLDWCGWWRRRQVASGDAMLNFSTVRRLLLSQWLPAVCHQCPRLQFFQRDHCCFCFPVLSHLCRCPHHRQTLLC